MTNFERSRKVYAISYEEVHINFAIIMHLILTIFSPFSIKIRFLQHPLLHAKLFIRIYFFRIVWYVTKKHLLSYPKLGTFMITVKKKLLHPFPIFCGKSNPLFLFRNRPLLVWPGLWWSNRFIGNRRPSNLAKNTNAEFVRKAEKHSLDSKV